MAIEDDVAQLKVSLAEVWKNLGEGLAASHAAMEYLRTANSAGVSGLSIMMAMLVTELDKAHSLDKSAFSLLLRQTADSAEATAAQSVQEKLRLDLILLRETARLIDDPKPAWKPTVIEGGKVDPQDN